MAKPSTSSSTGKVFRDRTDPLTPPKRPTYPIPRRPAKSIIPPDVVDGVSDRPVLVRNTRIRYAAGREQSIKNQISKKVRVGARGVPKLGPKWETIEVTIPREIAEIAGYEAGMTVCMEAYVDGRIRMFTAGDILSREDELL